MTKSFYHKQGLTGEKDSVVKEVDRGTRDTHRCVCLATCGLLERKRMGKPHVPKQQLNAGNSRHHVKLGNDPLNPLCYLQKARLELVEPNIKAPETSTLRQQAKETQYKSAYFALASLILPIIFQYSISAPAMSFAFNSSSSGNGASKYSNVSKSIIWTPLGFTANT